MLQRILCSFFLMMLVCCGAFGGNATAADFRVQDMDLQVLDAALKAHQGKVVVLNFFATWCPPCREEIPGLVKLNTAYKGDKVVILGICVDEDKKTLPGFVKQMKINYPVYWTKGEVPARYGVRTIPHNVIYTTKGTVAANVTGFVSEEELKDFLNTLLEQK